MFNKQSISINFLVFFIPNYDGTKNKQVTKYYKCMTKLNEPLNCTTMSCICKFNNLIKFSNLNIFDINVV